MIHKNEIFGISTIECNTVPWMRTTLLHDRAINLSRAKERVYSDSVVCLGKIHEHLQSMQHWKATIAWFMNTPEHLELNGIDGEPVESEWNVFPGHTILELLHGIQRKVAENRIRPEEFKDPTIFMSMYSDIDWTKDGNLETCVSSSTEVKAYANRFPKGHWSFFGPGMENMVWNARLQAKRFVEPICTDDHASSPRRLTSNFSRNKCLGLRIREKQERRKGIDLLQW